MYIYIVIRKHRLQAGEEWLMRKAGAYDYIYTSIFLYI